MLLEGICILQLGCGIAGDMAGGLLSRLGAEVRPVHLDPCPMCGADCDVNDEWRSTYRAQKHPPKNVRSDDLRELLRKQQDVGGALVDGFDRRTLELWERIAKENGIPTVVFGTGSNANLETAACDGFGGEAMSGAIGTIGDSGSPTPFGYLFGEVNVAVRGAGALMDEMLRKLYIGATAADEILLFVTAADACIDAMDNPWQEYSLPGPVHRSPNSLTRENYFRTGPQKVGLVPYGLFQARDSWVAFVGASTTHLIAEQLERPELLTDERFATVEGRVANREFVVGLLQQWIGGYESGDELVAALGERVVVAVSRSLSDVFEAHQEILGFDNPTQPYRISTTGTIS